MAMAAMAQPLAGFMTTASGQVKGAGGMALDASGGRGEWWQANIAALANHRPELLELVCSCPAMAGDCPVVAGEPWPGVAGHLKTVSPDAQGLVVFLGMGLGHGPLLILRERLAVAQIAVVEPSLELFRAALAETDLRPLIASGKVFFFVGEVDWEGFETAVTRIAALEDTHVLRHPPSFQWRPELYGPVNDRAYMLLNQLNASGSTTRQCGPVFVENRFANLALLNHSHNLDALRDSCKGKPAVLVAAGPSLNRGLAELQKIVGRCVLVAADSALAPLLKAGIVPDFVTSIDYLDLNFEKVAPFLGDEWPFSLVAMIKTTPLVAKRFPARHLFLAFADDYPQRWVVEALGIKTLAQNASSVAHLSLGLALVMGCDPVIMVGQDLSYTTAAGDHADGTIIMRDNLPRDREIFQVPAVGGGTVPTDRQFLSLLKTFEDIVGETPRRYVNASVAGARIRGTVEMGLAVAAAEFLRAEVPVGSIVDRALMTGPRFQVAGFVAAARKQLAAMAQVQGELAAARRLGRKAQEEVARLAGGPGRWQGFGDLPAPTREVLSRFDRLNGEIDAIETVWMPVLELTFGMLSDNDRQRERNELLGKREGYLPWVTAELARIQEINQRRSGVLEDYGAKLGHLLAHLEAEEDLAGRGGAGDRERIALHLAAGNYALARRLVADVKATGKADAELLLLSGEARAGMLDFSGAHGEWHRAVAMASGLEQRVVRLRRRFCDEWFGFAERYGNPGEGGDNFPHLLPLWVARIVAVAGDRQLAAPLLAPFFERQAGRLEALLAREDVAEVGDILLAWGLVDQDSPLRSSLLAHWYLRQGEHDHAVREVERLLAVEPANLGGLHFVVRALLAAGRYDDGVARLRQAVVVNPESALLWEEIGDLLFATQDYAAAATAYEQCFLALPDRSESLVKMGNCYLRRGETRAAIAAYESVLARNPNHAEARQLLVDAGQRCCPK